MTIEAEKGESIWEFTKRLVIIARRSDSENKVGGTLGVFNGISLIAHSNSRSEDLDEIYYLKLEISQSK